jgi:hypothetical protein
MRERIVAADYGRRRIGKADYLFARTGTGYPVLLLHGFGCSYRRSATGMNSAKPSQRRRTVRHTNLGHFETQRDERAQHAQSPRIKIDQIRSARDRASLPTNPRRADPAVRCH